VISKRHNKEAVTFVGEAGVAREVAGGRQGEGGAGERNEKAR
jgi:hypothetical protein